MQLGSTTPACHRPTRTVAFAQPIRPRCTLLPQRNVISTVPDLPLVQVGPQTACRAAGGGPAPVSESQPQQLVGEDAAAFDVSKQTVQSWSIFFTLLTTVLGALYVVSLAWLAKLPPRFAYFGSQLF